MPEKPVQCQALPSRRPNPSLPIIFSSDPSKFLPLAGHRQRQDWPGAEVRQKTLGGVPAKLLFHYCYIDIIVNSIFLYVTP